MSNYARMSEDVKDTIQDTIRKHNLADTLADKDNPTTSDIQYVRLFARLDLEAKSQDNKLQEFERRIEAKIEEAIKSDELSVLKNKLSDLETKYQDLRDQVDQMEVVTESLDQHNQHLSRYISLLQARVTELTHNNLALSIKSASDNRRNRRLNFRFYTSKRLTSDPAKLKNKVEFAKLMWKAGICAAFGKDPDSDCSNFLVVGHALQENPNPPRQSDDSDFKRPTHRSIGVFASRKAAAEFWANKDAVSDFAKDNGYKASVGSDWDRDATSFLVKWGNHPKVRRVHLIDGVLYLRFNDSADRTHKVLNEFATKLKDTILPVHPVVIKNQAVRGLPPAYDDMVTQNYCKSAYYDDTTDPAGLSLHKPIQELSDESQSEESDDCEDSSDEEPEEEEVHVAGGGRSQAEDVEATEAIDENVRLFYSQVTRQTRQNNPAAASALPNSQPPPLRQRRNAKPSHQPDQSKQKGAVKAPKKTGEKGKVVKKKEKALSPQREKTPDKKKIS